MPGMQRLVSEGLGEAEEIPPRCKDQDCKPCNVPLDNYLPQLHTWLEGLSTSSDLKSEVSSIKDSEILDLDINCVNNFDNVVLLNKKHKKQD